MRKAFLTVTLVGALGLLLAAVSHRERRAFTLGVTSDGPAVELQSGVTVCQIGIDVPRGAGFDAVRLVVGTFGKPFGPRLVLTVKDARARILGRGTLPPGYPDIVRAPYQRVDVGHVGDRRRVSVCVTNAGHGRIAIYGSAGISAPSQLRDSRGEALPTDMDLIFLRKHGRSQLSLTPDILRRAALFKGEGVGVGTLWIILGLILVGVPFGLWRACSSADDGNL